MEVVATVRQGKQDVDLRKEIRKLIATGIKLFRVNAGKFFGDMESLIKQINVIYSCSDDVKIVLDIPYPGKKYRISMENSYKRDMKKGELIVAAFNGNRPCEGINDFICVLGSVNKDDLKIGKRIYYDDGSGEFEIRSCIKEGIYELEILNSWVMFDKKSISINKIPKEHYLDYINNICLKVKIEEIALSFIETKEDLMDACLLKKKFGFQIISKIESELGVQNAEIIAEMSDGIMIGRGDLALYSNYTRLLEFEEILAEVCYRYGCKYYVATGILSSMCEKSIPSRSELIDVAFMMKLRPDFIVLNYNVVFSENIDKVIKIINQIYINEQSRKSESTKEN